MEVRSLPVFGQHDQVGIGWRAKLGSELDRHLDKIDLLELRAEDFLHAGPRALRAFESLGREGRLALHGSGPSALGPDPLNDALLAALVTRLQPRVWSEPVTDLPLPPGANLAATTLLASPGDLSDRPLFLDLHQLYADSRNSGLDPYAVIESFPLSRVALVHVSGGQWTAEAGSGLQRLVSNGAHDVPDAIFRLLERIAALAPQPFAVVVQRNDNFPSLEFLLEEVERARAAMRRGRCKWRSPVQRLAALERQVV